MGRRAPQRTLVHGARKGKGRDHFSFSDRFFTTLSWALLLLPQCARAFAHPDVEKWSIIQQRNVIRVRLEYDWITDRQAFLGFDRPTWIRWLNRHTMFFLTTQLCWQYISEGTSRFQGKFLRRIKCVTGKWLAPSRQAASIGKARFCP